MVVESILAYLHLVAILAMVVFLTSEAALCRVEWLNDKAVMRLVHVNRIYGFAVLMVLLTGLARMVWGVKGVEAYASQPLLHAKVLLFLGVGFLSIVPTWRFLRWRRYWLESGALPSVGEIRSTRKLVMVEAHVIALVPLAAVLMARGVGA